MSDIAISSRSCTERHGDFSESVVFHSSYEVSGFLFVVCLFFWLGCLVFVFVVCFCWLLRGCWKGDTLGIVSLYSHVWEWTISTNGLMTVRASSAHGTGKKKNIRREELSGQLIVLLGVVRRVAAGGHFSNAKRSPRKDSGSAAGVTGRLAKVTLS